MCARRLPLLFGLILVALAGCGGGDGDGGQQGGPAGAPARAAPELTIVRPDARSTVRSARVRVEGTVTSGATVEVGGRRATIEGPANKEGFDRWTAEARLKRGRNVIEVTAASEGETATERIVVVRAAPKPDDPDGDGSDGSETADNDPVEGDQGGAAADPGGAQGGAGGSGGNQGGAGGSEGNQGGAGGSEGNQGGTGGSEPDQDQGDPGGSEGGQGGPVGGAPEGDQGGPPASPPPPRVP